MKLGNKIKICFENKEKINEILNDFFTKFEEDEIKNAKKEFVEKYTNFLTKCQYPVENKIDFEELMMLANRAENELDIKGVNRQNRKNCEFYFESYIKSRELDPIYINTSILLVRDKTSTAKDGVFNWYLYEISKVLRQSYSKDSRKIRSNNGYLKYSKKALVQLLSNENTRHLKFRETIQKQSVFDEKLG